MHSSSVDTSPATRPGSGQRHGDGHATPPLPASVNDPVRGMTDHQA